MRIRSLLAGTTLAGAMLVAGAAQAQFAAVARADLNIRSGPGPQYPIVGVINRNDTATVINCAANAGWCEVRHGAVIGWSSASYLVPMTGTQAAASGETVVTTYPQAGAVAGGAGGAVIGALVGGPVGAVVGGAVGAGLGAATPPAEVRTYVLANRVAPINLDAEVAVGTSLPAYAALRPVPGYAYSYTYVNGVPVLVEPATRRVVYIYR